MAKYTDPNTGVKYSTHTGLKVFTIIVVILLVISVVLNVVFYMQSSDDSVIDSDGSEEFAAEDGDEGDDLDGALNGNGEDFDEDVENDGTEEDDKEIQDSFEGIVDIETVIEKELGNGYYGVELSKGYAVRTSEFREHGAATCLYYYPDGHWMRENGEEFEGCAYCDGPCEGHERWITKNGVVYEWPYYMEPDVKTQVLYAEDGSTDINSEIRVSLVFDGNPEGPYYVEYTDYYYNDSPYIIEIASLTDEPLEIESVELKQYIYYENTWSIFSPKYTEFHSESGLDVNLRDNYDYTICICPDVTTIYSPGGTSGSFLFTLTLKDGNSYSFEYWFISIPDRMIGADIEYVD